jgi:hypothetical protein
MMNTTGFYDQVMIAMAQSADEHHTQLARLHAEALRSYQTALGRLTPEAAEQPIPNHDDPRTVAQIIGHITAWDRFALLAAGDILVGIQHPRMITDLSGYREPDGTFPEFATIDDFNAYHAQKYTQWPWEDLRHHAEDTAVTLYVSHLG